MGLLKSLRDFGFCEGALVSLLFSMMAFESPLVGASVFEPVKMIHLFFSFNFKRKDSSFEAQFSPGSSRNSPRFPDQTTFINHAFSLASNSSSPSLSSFAFFSFFLFIQQKDFSQILPTAPAPPTHTRPPAVISHGHSLFNSIVSTVEFEH
jgi:hypothetical protein